MRLDGSSTQKKRTEAIREFQNAAADSPTIMLLSLKAGGLGLNLTAASHVFLMDPVRFDYSSICFISCRSRSSHFSAFCFRLGILRQRSSASTAATVWDRGEKSLSPRLEKRTNIHLCGFFTLSFAASQHECLVFMFRSSLSKIQWRRR